MIKIPVSPCQQTVDDWIVSNRGLGQKNWNSIIIIYKYSLLTIKEFV